ncbi:MAG: nucleotidyltransferase family protein [Blautia sp.]|nr:nucleotidyltransferase family protein [Blautia sp.]
MRDHISKTAGIIAEYNPFHAGHKYQIDYIRNTLGADHVVVVMSPDFVQRGEPALLSKYTRTRTALENGADLVLELPVQFATSSAEGFAMGGVSLLSSCGIIDYLCFGAEDENVDLFNAIAEIPEEEPTDYIRILKDSLKAGCSYPLARSKAIISYFSDDPSLLPKGITLEMLSSILSKPNNILAIEYCKALHRQNSNMIPCAIRRKGSDYHAAALPFSPKESENDLTLRYPSATALRHLFHTNKDLDAIPDSETVYTYLKEAARYGEFVLPRDFDSIYRYRLLSESASSLADYRDVTQSLANRIIHHRNDYRTFSDFCRKITTKESTQLHIQRGMTHMLLNLKTSYDRVPYIRVLGVRKESSFLVKQIKENSALPVLTKYAYADKVLSDFTANTLSEKQYDYPYSYTELHRFLSENLFASNLYESILCQKTNLDFKHEYQKQPVIL